MNQTRRPKQQPSKPKRPSKKPEPKEIAESSGTKPPGKQGKTYKFGPDVPAS